MYRQAVLNSLIKIAEDRTIVGDLGQAGATTFKDVSTLSRFINTAADNLGMAQTGAVNINNIYSKNLDNRLSNDDLVATNGNGVNGLSWEGNIALSPENKGTAATLLHEYGHNLDKEWAHPTTLLGKARRGLLGEYKFNHGEYERAANDNARKLLSTIGNEQDRNRATELFNRMQRYNENVWDITKYKDRGEVIGQHAGMALGAAGGGYLGYKGGDALYTAFNQNSTDSPTIGRYAARWGGAALGGLAGGYLGNRLGKRIGSSIGNRFVDQDKLNAFKQEVRGINKTRAKDNAELTDIIRRNSLLQNV